MQPSDGSVLLFDDSTSNERAKNSQGSGSQSTGQAGNTSSYQCPIVLQVHKPKAITNVEEALYSPCQVARNEGKSAVPDTRRANNRAQISIFPHRSSGGLQQIPTEQTTTLASAMG